MELSLIPEEFSLHLCPLFRTLFEQGLKVVGQGLDEVGQGLEEARVELGLLH